ncbi:MAG: hypothetical protein D6719_09130 [Candidatus Dadabacteria bacterium]|nr:MAG: hypothetical protein D6719_09130 [Candidatus Dadabacteria bacterium]
MLFPAILLAAPCVMEPIRISVSNSGVEADGKSLLPIISRNSRYVLFNSTATNLIPGATSGDWQVYLYDRKKKTLTLISKSASGTPGNGSSFAGGISKSGRWVVFVSSATNLVSGDTNGKYDAFLVDTRKNTIELISKLPSGTQFNNDTLDAAISPSGKFILLNTSATNVDPADTDTVRDIYLYNRRKKTFKLVSVSSAGVKGDKDSALSYNSFGGKRERFFVFDSKSSNLVSGNTNTNRSIYRYDRKKGETILVSVDSSGNASLDDNSKPAISKNGRLVGFWSDGSLVPEDTNGKTDSYIRDMRRSRTTIVSLNKNGAPSDAYQVFRDMTPNARYISLASAATDLVDDTVNGKTQVYLRKRRGNKTWLISKNSSGDAGNDTSNWGHLSANGKWLAFNSDATNLVTNDTNGVMDVFLVRTPVGRHCD